MITQIHYQFGLPEPLRRDAALLYDEAFGAKFAVAIPNREKRLRLLEESFSPSFAVVALAHDRLAGLAGFQTPEGSLTKGMTVRKLFSHLGFWGGLRATAVFSFYDRTPQESQLLMDGIVVSSEMRGRGIGSRLLHMLKQFAHEEGFATIRLDVIDTNPNAKRLYERQGFVATQTERFEYLRWLLGFGASTTMIFEIKGDTE